MLPPAFTVAGAVLLIPKSARAANVIETDDVLLPVAGSKVDELAETVLVMVVPATAAALTFNVTVNAANGASGDSAGFAGSAADARFDRCAPAARFAIVQLIVPVPLTAGVIQFHPAGELSA